MSRHRLGSGRDYKTMDRQISANLRWHCARMHELISIGMGREEASRMAYQELMKRKVEGWKP